MSLPQKQRKFKPRIKLIHNIIILYFFQLSGLKNNRQRFWCPLARQQRSKRCLLIARNWLKPFTLARIYAGKIIISHAFNVFLLYCHLRNTAKWRPQIINSSPTFTSFIQSVFILQNNRYFFSKTVKHRVKCLMRVKCACHTCPQGVLLSLTPDLLLDCSAYLNTENADSVLQSRFIGLSNYHTEDNCERKII